jgi:osmotically-inducible protein OsmY
LTNIHLYGVKKGKSQVKTKHMRTNEELQADVQKAIQWEPLLHSAEIGVTVKDGVVSLTGTVDSYLKKVEAESAVKRVTGVKGLVENIIIKFPDTLLKTDLEIANEVITGLENNWMVPPDSVMVKVENGWVTLTGELPWNYQKEAAKNGLNSLAGVKGVLNHINIKSATFDAIEKEKVEHAIDRSWSLENSDIKVNVNGNSVTLTGTVDSWYQKEEAERIAWKTPGIGHVTNDLVIDYKYVLTSL